MHPLQGKNKTISTAVILWMLNFSYGQNAYNTYALLDGKVSSLEPHIVTVNERMRRDAPMTPATTVLTPPLVAVTATASATTTSSNVSVVTNNTDSITTSTAAAVAAVTQIPLLGRNGTGILRVNTTNQPRVSEPIYPDDNIAAEVFNETPDKIQAEHNIKNLTIDTHNFYNSTFIGNVTYFNEYWANITKQNAETHAVLSNSHRRATTLRLSFEFPFYGHGIRNITVATGGFVYTGEHVHNWLAATQYIAPLMANFDTTLTNDSYVKMYDDGEKFTTFWENVTLQEDTSKKFTFAVSLYKNGDIIFAYKNIPIAVQNITDNEHPVKVGISDAYLQDRILFLVRRKTIYEYHRANFKHYNITNNTILKLTALPTCLQYDSCESCVNHDTGFNCMWCEAIHLCSSGTDRNKQDWMLRNCDKAPISEASSCAARGAAGGVGGVSAAEGGGDAGRTAYTTDPHGSLHTDVNTLNNKNFPSVRTQTPLSAPVSEVKTAHSPLGGVVAALVAITLVVGLAAWALYAFKNPHTRSGQLLIKYRPSQWSWRRGEARYTAATIHM